MRGMVIGEVLNMFPDLDANTLYYWESLGFLRPKKIRKRRVDRRIYTEKDLEKIELAYRYYQQGLAPKICCENAERDAQQTAEDLNARLERLREELEEAGLSLGGMSSSDYIELTKSGSRNVTKLELIDGIELVLRAHRMRERDNLED